MKRFVGCLALAGAVSLQAGCSTINPYTGENRPPRLAWVPVLAP